MKKGKKVTKKKIVEVKEETKKITKLDIKLLVLLLLVTGFLTFYKLGSFKNPQTFHTFYNSGESVDLELNTKEAQDISIIRYFNGAETGSYTVLGSNDGVNFKSITDFESKSAFAWEDVVVDGNFKYVSIQANSEYTTLGEIQLYDKYGNKVFLKETSEQGKLLIDESDTVPVKISYLNSTYFDEIYFATSGYQYAHGLTAMEWVHPPLGKLIIALPVLIFGMNTFSYRLMGAIAGLLMIVVMYILAKRLFKSTKWAMFAGLLMAFDNFRFAQTRMATVDSFLVLFILLAVLFMKDYLDLDKDAKLSIKRRKLLLSGLFIGCSIATKWTGLYAALGLAIVLFIHLFKQTESKKNAKIITSQRVVILLGFLTLIPIIIYYLTLFLIPKSTNLILALYYITISLLAVIYIITKLIKRDKSLIKILILCLIAFILIPLIIYLTSYILFPNVACYVNDGIKGIINQIKEMYNYHSKLTDTHPFQSVWYQWPIMYKPVWLYTGNLSGNMASVIVGIGNPFIWWFGVLTTIITLIRTFIKKEQENILIIVMIMCTFLPYALINRAMFMYHYFPTLPFVMLTIVSFMKYITEKTKTNMYLKFYIALVIVAFFVFYPITSGMVTTTDYVNSLKWLSSWIF